MAWEELYRAKVADRFTVHLQSQHDAYFIPYRASPSPDLSEAPLIGRAFLDKARPRVDDQSEEEP